MLHFDNCRVFGKKFVNKYCSICIGSTLVYIDYAANAMYWIERMNQVLWCTANDIYGNKYKVYHNKQRNLACAIPEE